MNRICTVLRCDLKCITQALSTTYRAIEPINGAALVFGNQIKQQSCGPRHTAKARQQQSPTGLWAVLPSLPVLGSGYPVAIARVLAAGFKFHLVSK